MKAAAVLTGFLLLGVTVLPASATLLGASRSICGADLPDAVAASMATTGAIPRDPLGNENCPALCNRWVTTCKGAVGIAKSCFTAAFTKLVSLRNAQCNFYTDPFQKQFCLDQATSDRNFAKSELATSVADGISFCEGLGHVTCRFTCD